MLGIVTGLLCALCWATGSIMMKDLSKKMDPFTLNAPRTLVGSLATVALCFGMGSHVGLVSITPQQMFFLVGSMIVGGGIGDSLYVSSLSRIGVSRAFPVANSYPALTLGFGVLFLSEILSLGVISGLMLVTAGVMLISRMSIASNIAERQVTTSGISFALMAAVCWAVSVIMMAPGIQGLDSILVASVRLPALSAMLWVVVALRGTWRKLLFLNAREWCILVAGGLIGWGVGSLLLVITVSLIGPTQAAIITSTSPMFALPLSALFLRERFSRGVLVGTVLTICGVILVS